jgi:hypothetical protein
MSVDGDTLLVRAWGVDDSLEDVQGYGMAVIQACIESKCLRVLCDERDLEYRLGTIDTYRAAEFISQNVPRLVRVALVCLPEQIEDAAFWENVAVNRGMLARAFKDMDTARAWVGESDRSVGSD